MAFNFMAAVGGAAKAGKEGIENKREENKAMLIRYTDRADADLKVMRQKRAAKLSQITGYVDMAKALGLSPSQSRAVAMSADADKQLSTIKDRRDLNHSVADIFKGVKYDTKGSNDPATMLPTYKASTPIPVAPDKGFLGAIFAKPDTVEQTKANVRRGLTPDQDARLNGTMINPQGSGVNIQDTNALLDESIKQKSLQPDPIAQSQFNRAASDLTKAYASGLGATNYTEKGGFQFPDKLAGNKFSADSFLSVVQSYLRRDPDGPSAARGKLIKLFQKANTKKGHKELSAALNPNGVTGFVPKVFTHMGQQTDTEDPSLKVNPADPAKPKIIAPSIYTPAHLKEAKKNSGAAGSPEKRKYFDIRTAMLKKLIKQHPDKSKKELRAILDAMEK